MEQVMIAVTSILGNGLFIGTTAYLAKRWMDKVDANTEQVRAERKEDAKKLADDLKESVIEHQREIRDTTDKLERHLNRIYDQLRIANGRTAKIEGGLQAVKAVCAERHKGNGSGITEKA